MSSVTIVPASDRCDTLERGLPSTPKETVMVVYVTYRVPVEVELEIATGEIINVHIMDEKLEGPLGVFNYELVPIGGRLKKRALELVEVADVRPAQRHYGRIAAARESPAIR